MDIEEVDRIIDATLPNMEGWCTPAKGKRMARLVVEAAKERPDTFGPLCVELGVFGGRSLICMGLAVEHCLARRGRVHGIDPYIATAALEGENSKANDEWWAKIDYPKILAGALKKINELNLHGVTIIASRSESIVDQYPDLTIDVLHIDANHSELTSRRDVDLWAPRVRPAGFVVFDDIDWVSTARAQGDLIDRGFSCLEGHTTWAIYRAPS
jgi:hypothetical protein